MAGAPCRLLLLLLGSGGVGRRTVVVGPSFSPSPLLPRWLALSHRLSHARAAASAASAAEDEAEDADPLINETTSRLNPRRAARLALEHPSASLLPVVAILGRPNVGKSALFNRLCGSREALVADTPAPGAHTTRDWREGLGRLGDLRFRVVDTSGLEPTLAAAAAAAAATAGGGRRAAATTPTTTPPPPLQARAAQLTSRVVARSHVALVVLDATAGVTQDDVDLGLWLRRERGLWRRSRRRDGEDDNDDGDDANAPALIAGPSSGPAVLLVLNKAEARAARKRMPETLADVHANLGVLLPHAAEEEGDGEGGAASNDDDDSRIVALSARSGEGLADLYVALRPHLEAAAASLKRRAREEGEQASSSSSLFLPQSPLLWPPPRPPPPLPGDASAADDDNNNNPPSSSSSSPRPDPSLLPDWPRPDDGPMRVAIMGLPNAGKSTLLNALLGRERALTGPEPGLTRDAPHAWLEWRGGLRVELTDTAGWVPGSDLIDLAASDVKKPAGATTPKEKKEAAAEARALAAAALERGRRAMDAAHVVVLLLDAHRLDRDGRLITKAELGLAAEAVKAGKALVVALNKADLLVGGEEEEGGGGKKKKRGGGGNNGKGGASQLPTWPEASKMAAELASALDARFADAGKPAVVALSALEAAAAAGVAGVGTSSPSSSSSSSSRAGAAAVLDACAVAYARWTRRSGTSAVQRALDRCAARLAGTPAGAAVARVKWAAQLKARPPTFALSLRGAKPLPQGGDRFLASALREGLGLEGVPVRVSVQYNVREDRGGAGRRRGGGAARRR